MGSAIAASVAGPAILDAQKATSLPQGIGVEPDFDSALPKSRGATLGDRPPLNGEERIAKAIITKAPIGPTPIDVAQFFLAVSKGKYGSQWQPYAQGWPTRWNPVIVNFFQATGTTPQGDLTPWCAAFLNWCFLRAGKGVPTHNASSGSFRTFGTETTSPRIGDIVVFKHTGAVETDMRGHVGFFVRLSENAIDVLGGNQIEGHERSHMVSSKPIPKANGILTFHSYRTDPRLHA
jgi:uncharacterized protein (TIGR02594 family)